MDLHQLCHHAIEAAKRAGATINHYRERQVRIDHKEGAGSEAAQVVTEVDHKAQRTIIDTLTPTLGQYDLALLAEESEDDGRRLSRPAFWCIDPMDGTLAFVRNSQGYAVSIALVARTGEPLIGVVYDPLNKDLYYAIKGGGAFRNHQPLAPPPLDRNAPLVLRTDISFENHRLLAPTRRGLEKISTTLGLHGAAVEFHIGAVMNALSVVNQPNHCYFKYPRADNKGGSLWDYAATACLLSEAGAIACDSYGEPMELNRPDSTFMNHRGIICSPNRELADRIIDFNRTLEKR